MKATEIRKLSSLELEKKLRDVGEELMHLRLRKQTGQVEKLLVKLLFLYWSRS